MLAIAAGAPRLLVVRLESTRHRVVNHQPHIGFVDPHTECVGGDDCADPLRHERILDVMPARVVETRVVSGGRDSGALENRGEVIDCFSGRCVDDSEPLVPLQDLDEALLLLGVVLHRYHVVVEIRAVESGDDRFRISERQLTGDIAPHLRGRRGSQRYRRRRAKLFVDLLDAQVAGAEIVTPLADAMRFVDREERYSRFAKPLRRLTIIEPLGRDVKELDLAALDSCKPIRDLPRR